MHTTRQYVSLLQVLSFDHNHRIACKLWVLILMRSVIASIVASGSIRFLFLVENSDRPRYSNNRLRIQRSDQRQR